MRLLHISKVHLSSKSHPSRMEYLPVTPPLKKHNLFNNWNRISWVGRSSFSAGATGHLSLLFHAASTALEYARRRTSILEYLELKLYVRILEIMHVWRVLELPCFANDRITSYQWFVPGIFSIGLGCNSTGYETTDIQCLEYKYLF